jgi:hypothetical protein
LPRCNIVCLNFLPVIVFTDHVKYDANLCAHVDLVHTKRTQVTNFCIRCSELLNEAAHDRSGLSLISPKKVRNRSVF